MRAALRVILLGGASVGGLALLKGEVQGLGIDFTVTGGLGSVAVKDTTTPANNLSNVSADTFLTQSGTSPKLVMAASGLLVQVSAGHVAIEYDASTGTYFNKGPEPAATNLLLRSQEFDNAAWAATAGAIGVTPNAAVAPDGQTTADLCTPTTANTTHKVRQTGSTTAAVHTHSFFVKPNGYTKVGLREDFAVGLFAAFLLSGSGSVIDKTVGTTATITALTNGWYCLTFTPSSASANMGTAAYVLATAYAGGDPAVAWVPDGASGVYMWQADLILGSIATSPIVTAGATVTRAADNQNAATTTIPFSATAGLLVIGGRTAKGGGVDQTLWSIDDGTANERIRVYRPTADGHIHVVVTDGGVDQADIDLGAVANDTTFTVGLSWAANSIKASLSGGAVTTDATATLPTMTTLHVGRAGTAGTEWNGRVGKALYAPRVPANDAELQSLQTRVA